MEEDGGATGAEGKQVTEAKQDVQISLQEELKKADPNVTWMSHSSNAGSQGLHQDVFHDAKSHSSHDPG